MMRRLLVLVFVALPAMTQPVTVSTGPDGAARIRFAGGKQTTIPKEPGQTGISAARTAPDGTVGWLAEVRVDGVSDPIAATLILWRAGKVLRRFSTQQSFYSWTFYAGGEQVAYHTGPLHGESKSHCELLDVRSGRLIAQWEGDLEQGKNRPAWTNGLSH